MTIIRMSQQIVALPVTAVLLFLNSGCMVNKVQKLTVNQVKQPNQEHLVGVTTKTGSRNRIRSAGRHDQSGHY